jgi:hypothetical protein
MTGGVLVTGCSGGIGLADVRSVLETNLLGAPSDRAEPVA